MRAPATLLPLALVLAASACHRSYLEGRTAPEQQGSLSSYVVDEDDLERSGSSSLLNAIASRVRSMSIMRPQGECPEITLRGSTTLVRRTSPPVVYVDGARAINTCILEQLTPNDVSRVEIYPLGMTRRPGYPTQPGGLILVFMRDGS
jgi:hypothetical protein